MWRKTGAITLQFLRLFMRDRLALLWTLFLPIVWIVLTTAMTGGGGSPTTSLSIGFVMEDPGPTSRLVIDSLDRDPSLALQEISSRLEAREQVALGNVSFALVIPESFGSTLERGEPVQLSVFRPQNASATLVEGLLQKAVQRASANANAATFALTQLRERQSLTPSESVTLWRDSFAQADQTWANPAVQVRHELLASTEKVNIPSGADQTSPGFTTMFLMLGVFFSAATLVEERQDGTLQRLLSTSLSRASLLVGKFTGIFLLGFLQFVILALVGQLVGAHWGRDPLGVLIMGAVFVLALTGLGTLLASFAKTSQQAGAFAILLTMVCGMLGGSWWPLEITSPAMQTAAKFTPVYWGLDGFNQLITYGQGLNAVWTNVLVLLGIAGVSLLLGTLLFKYE
ncbi:MAG: ABC transporter permease [Coprothermobacterota bacterium]|nr:ABC transporter permease [Coprothermobacterota bacterium]